MPAAITLKNIESRRRGDQLQHTMKTTTDYQLESLRARFAARGYEPLNHHRLHPARWVGYGIGIGCLIAAFAWF